MAKSRNSAKIIRELELIRYIEEGWNLVEKLCDKQYLMRRGAK